MKSRMLVVFAVVTMVLLAAVVPASAYYQIDDFNSATPGQSITVSPLQWNASSPAGATLNVNSGLHSGWTTLAIEGSTSSVQFGKAAFYRPLGGIPTTGQVALSFKAWAVATTTIANIGFDRTGSGDLGIALGFNPNAGRGWEFDARSVGGDLYNFFGDINIGANQTALGMIIMDYDAGKTWAELRNASGGLLGISPQYSASGATTFYGVALEQLIYASAGYPDGLDVDDITVSSPPVPEPSALLALSTGLMGLAGFVIRRRK